MKRTIILRNSATCSFCGDQLESKHVHDFVQCKCGAICVDGGKEYLKRSFQHKSDLIETSITKEIDNE